MTQRERYVLIIDYFIKHMPDAKTELNYSSTWGLLVAVILSAQCTDKRVNMVTPKLLESFPTPRLMSLSSPEVIFGYIKSISYPNSKANHLHKCAIELDVIHNGEIPSDRVSLESLAGVGRKTANVILSVAFSIPAMAVDTHVFRVSHRIGLVLATSKTPLDVEKKLTQNIPTKYLNDAHHWLILHGRYTCMARKPKCEVCGISAFCKSYGIKSIG